MMAVFNENNSPSLLKNVQRIVGRREWSVCPRAVDTIGTTSRLAAETASSKRNLSGRVDERSE
jgi:hypothetical protein